MKKSILSAETKAETRRGRLKQGSLEYVLKHAVQQNRSRKFLQPNCAERALMAGHGIEGCKAIWYRKGDGKKFGCKTDQYFHQTCQKLGYTVIQIQ